MLDFAKSSDVLFDLLVLKESLSNRVLDISHSDLVFELLLIFLADSELLALPVHLIDDEGV